MGHGLWLFCGSSTAPVYSIGGEVSVLEGADDAKNVYLRRSFALARLPRHAWIQVISSDRLRLYVNGIIVARHLSLGHTQGTVVDIRRHLRVGRNTVAIALRQGLVGTPPAVAVDGAYVVQDSERSLGSEGLWRCHSFREKANQRWYLADYDDQDWSLARKTKRTLWARVNAPPRATRIVGDARWVSPPSGAENKACVRRDFEIFDRPERAWIRLTSTAPYRLAVNGFGVDRQEDTIATRREINPVERVYDITAFLQRGHNVFAVLLQGPAPRLSLLAEVEVQDRSGRIYRPGTDRQWLGRRGWPSDWLDPELLNRHEWQLCSEESGDIGTAPWQRRLQHVAFDPPSSFTFRSLVERASLTAAVATLTGLLSWLMVGLLSKLTSDSERTRAALANSVYLALIPAILLSVCYALSKYEARPHWEFALRGAWEWAPWSVLAGWGMLVLVAVFRKQIDWLCNAVHLLWGRWRLNSWPTLIVLALVVAGFVLRLAGISDEPLHHDEVRAYNQTQGIFERYYPSLHVHDDIPTQYITTSELVYYVTALSALVFDEVRYVVRFPSVCWGTLTIVLIWVVGRRLFSPGVGLVAAAIYTFAPLTVEIAQFGRYPSQAQFFALLTVYFFWRTISGSERIQRGALSLTAISFVATFLSWEGSGVMAAGMAIAGLVHRRGKLRTIFCDPAVWTAIAVVLSIIVLQGSVRSLLGAQRLYYGTGISDLVLTRMWLYPNFDLFYYVLHASWSPDVVFPMVGLVGAATLVIKHDFRQPARLVGITFLVTCLLMSSIMPVRAWRYIYHVVPLLILLFSAGLVAFVRPVIDLGRVGDRPLWFRGFVGAIGALVLVVSVVLASGKTIRCQDSKAFRLVSHVAERLRNPDVRLAAKYVSENFRDGDVILATKPHVLNHYLSACSTDYWPQSRPTLQTILSDRQPELLDYRSGATVIPSLEALEVVFSQHDRIWYVFEPSVERHYSLREVAAFIDRGMEIVFEDFGVLVLFRGPEPPSSLSWADVKNVSGWSQQDP